MGSSAPLRGAPASGGTAQSECSLPARASSSPAPTAGEDIPRIDAGPRAARLHLRRPAGPACCASSGGSASPPVRTALALLLAIGVQRDPVMASLVARARQAFAQAAGRLSFSWQRADQHPRGDHRPTALSPGSGVVAFSCERRAGDVRPSQAGKRPARRSSSATSLMLPATPISSGRSAVNSAESSFTARPASASCRCRSVDTAVRLAGAIAGHHPHRAILADLERHAAAGALAAQGSGR